MTQIKLTQKNFNHLINSLNHRMSNIEHDIKWMKKILGWQVYLISGIFVAIVSIVIKFIFFV